MANTLRTIKHFSILNNLFKCNNIYLKPCLQSRTLYAPTTLGIDSFIQQKERTKLNMQNVLEKFKERMTEFANAESKNMIFTEDLKNMIHLCENDEDIKLVINMMKKFNQQNQQLRFGNFIFGPVVMRLFHAANQPEIAFDCFKSPDLSGFFDQLITYQILLDLLYENGKYTDVLEAFDMIKGRQIQGTKYPKNIVVLVMAACYKLNSKESLDYALKLWRELNEIGHLPMRRATTFCAGLALNQNQPNMAMEIISNARNQNYTTVRNIKVAALADVGRIEDAFPILKGVLSEDVPLNGTIHTFNRDVMERVQKAVSASNNPDVTLEYNRLEQLFQKQGHISDTTLSEQLCSEIQPPPQMNNRQDVRYQRNPQVYSNRSHVIRQRPGLKELV